MMRRHQCRRTDAAGSRKQSMVCRNHTPACHQHTDEGKNRAARPGKSDQPYTRRKGLGRALSPEELRTESGNNGLQLTTTDVLRTTTKV